MYVGMEFCNTPPAWERQLNHCHHTDIRHGHQTKDKKTHSLVGFTQTKNKMKAEVAETVMARYKYTKTLLWIWSSSSLALVLITHNHNIWMDFTKKKRQKVGKYYSGEGSPQLWVKVKGRKYLAPYGTSHYYHLSWSKILFVCVEFEWWNEEDLLNTHVIITSPDDVSHSEEEKRCVNVHRSIYVYRM